MDGHFISLQDGKPWRCPNQHLLGIMRRERVNGGHAYRLYQLRAPLATDPDGKQPLEWVARHEGTCHDISCEVCGARKTWWAAKVVKEV